VGSGRSSATPPWPRWVNNDIHLIQPERVPEIMRHATSFAPVFERGENQCASGDEMPLLVACASRCRLSFCLPAPTAQVAGTVMHPSSSVCLVGEKRGGTMSVGASSLVVALAEGGGGGGGCRVNCDGEPVPVWPSARRPACRKKMHRAEAGAMRRAADSTTAHAGAFSCWSEDAVSQWLRMTHRQGGEPGRFGEGFVVGEDGIPYR
jgi:hypothetical protein